MEVLRSVNYFGERHGCINLDKPSYRNLKTNLIKGRIKANKLILLSLEKLDG